MGWCHGEPFRNTDPSRSLMGPGSDEPAGRATVRLQGGGRATVGGRVIEPGLSPSLSMMAAETEAAPCCNCILLKGVTAHH
jgi:hypothetical protein